MPYVAPTMPWVSPTCSAYDSLSSDFSPISSDRGRSVSPPLKRMKVTLKPLQIPIPRQSIQLVISPNTQTFSGAVAATKQLDKISTSIPPKSSTVARSASSGAAGGGGPPFRSFWSPETCSGTGKKSHWSEVPLTSLSSHLHPLTPPGAAITDKSKSVPGSTPASVPTPNLPPSSIFPPPSPPPSDATSNASQHQSISPSLFSPAFAFSLPSLPSVRSASFSPKSLLFSPPQQSQFPISQYGSRPTSVVDPLWQSSFVTGSGCRETTFPESVGEDWTASLDSQPRA